MFLRRLLIRGFKSFADRTVFDFTPGVSVIVGPNGSGKSNIVDAIAWVLGQQGAKALRGGSMEDVIFAGTPSRPALGRAEVALTIDNSSGVLPIEFSEVTLRRTLFRSGESEYAINEVPCRLLDIQELLSDSGIGRELHTIIGQGQLDDILAGRPEERRAVIEEAAGLLKHRKRKERAVRKLERVDADIERLGDVIAELRRQIRPLERQAELATKAEQIDAELREVRLKLWVIDYRRITDEQDAEAEQRAQTEVEELQRRLEAATASAESLEAELGRSGRSAEDIMATEYRLGGLRDRFDALARLADERRRHAEDLAMREPRGEAPTEAEIAEAQRALDDARAGREAAEAQTRDLQSERAAAQTAWEDAARAREDVVHLHGERAALRAAVEGAEQERRAIAERREAAGKTAERSSRQLAEVRAELGRLDEEETALSTRLDDAESKRVAGRGVLDRMGAQERDADRALEALRARIALLDEEIERAAGPASSLSETEGIIGPIAEQVRARPGYERALRAALGVIADALLARSRADAIAAVERLKRDGARATIVFPGGPRAPLPIQVRSVAQVMDDAGPHAASVRSMLAGIAIADSLAEATELANAHPGIDIVTTDGDRLGPTSVSGGVPTEIRDPIDERRRAARDAEAAGDALAALRRDAEHVAAEIAVLDAEIAELAEQMNGLDARVSGATERLAQLERDAHAAEREGSVLAGRAVEVEERLREDGERLKAVESQLSRAVSVEPSMDESMLAEIERRAAERALRLGEAGERERAAAATLEALRERARRIGEDRARWEAGRSGWHDQAGRAAAVAGTARAAAERLAAWATEAGERRARVEGDRAALEQRLASTRAQRRELTDAVEEARARAHEADLRRAERSHRISALVQRLRDDYDLAPEDAIEAVRVDGEDHAELTSRAKTLERRLGLLGRVNPIAMEQYGELVERHRFLTEQVDDLKRSRRDLVQIVEEVDRKIVEIFGTAFADIAREFTEVFDRLFPGGEGKLSLTDPDDLLDAGIEVEARPAGKRVKRVSLLSGGERSLVSIAILFAVFRARPSPFYLLDEVEAALDDVNLHRFLRIAQEFRETSQFVIVTHQKRTMEIAEALYGISMGDEGVSKVICERMATDAVPVPHAGDTVIELPE